MSGGPLFPTKVTERERTFWLNTFANIRVLAAASAETTEQLVAAATFVRRPAFEVIVHHDGVPEHVHFLISGVVRVFQARGDLEYTPKILVAPSHFADVAVLAGLPHQQSALETLTEAVTAQIPSALFEARLAADHAMCRAWLYSITRQFAVTIDYLKQNVFGGLPARLANVLLSYSDVFGTDLPDGWRRVGFELSYAALARQTACTRRAAINTMNALQEAQLVRSSEAGWQIRPRGLLEELLPGRLSLSYSLEDNREPELDD